MKMCLCVFVPHRQQEPIRKKTTVMKGCVIRVLVSRMVAHGYFATPGETGISKLRCRLDFLIRVASTAARAMGHCRVPHPVKSCEETI